MTTIKTVAEYCGVSVSTVSRALNNHPDVSQDAKDKVLEAVRKLHYVPNSSARDLVRTQTASIGVVVRGAETPSSFPSSVPSRTAARRRVMTWCSTRSPSAPMRLR